MDIKKELLFINSFKFTKEEYKLTVYLSNYYTPEKITEEKVESSDDVLYVIPN